MTPIFEDSIPGAQAVVGEWLLEASGLGVRRGGRWLLRDVDLVMHAGEIVSLVGPNGGGKTTLVKALLGIERPSAGTVTRARRLRTGYVPQKLTVGDSMPLTVSRLMTLTRRAGDAELTAALAETGVSHLLRRQVHELSGGEMQRVLIARALMGQPDLLVLDEPVQNVDFGGQVELYDLISALRQRWGCGVLLVSHDLHVVMRQTDRVICLSGHVCCTGVPDDVSRDPEYLRLFGPRAAGTLAVYHHDHDHEHAPSGAVVRRAGTRGGAHAARD